MALLEQADLTPPNVAELERRTGRRDVEAILRLAAAAGKVEAVERDRYYARPRWTGSSAALREMGAAESIVPAELRDRLGSAAST